MTTKKNQGSSPYQVWTRPKDWKPLPSPSTVPTVPTVPTKKITKKLGTTNSVNVG